MKGLSLIAVLALVFVLGCIQWTSASESRAAAAAADLREFERLKELYDSVNRAGQGWSAVELGEVDYDLDEIRETLEVFESLKKTLIPPSYYKTTFKENVKKVVAASSSEHVEADAPTTFDWREANADCVGFIRNQGECGSCWAFGCVESLSDRFCIKSNGTTKVNLSPQQLVSCNLDGLEGCSGGDPLTAFTYTSLEGVVDLDCIPYESSNGTSPTCAEIPHDSCINSSATYMRYKSELESIRWSPGEKLMQGEIFSNGPIEACFEVYEDFMGYTGGVYQHVNGSFLGGHCIKALGWGVDASTNTPYWIMQNSWGPSWGINGYFYILRGSDECGIEREGFSALPILN